MTAETGKVDFHPNRLRFMYAVNIVGAGLMGLLYLAVPDSMGSLLGISVEQTAWATGYAYSYMVGIGVFAILGLRSPFKFSAVLLLQAGVKFIWVLAVAVPGLVAGTLPTFVLMLVPFFALVIVGDLLVVPFRHFLAK